MIGTSPAIETARAKQIAKETIERMENAGLSKIAIAKELAKARRHIDDPRNAHRRKFLLAIAWECDCILTR